MGQQQLLLVILVTIIVGIATVVAINTFGSAADNANVSAVQNDLASIASAAQGYYMKPSMMNGGGNSFTGIDWTNIGGVPGDVNGSGNLENENGEYTFGTISDTSFVMTGSPSGGGGDIVALICPDDMAMSAPGGTAPSTCD